MSDTKLYRLTGGKAKELQGESIALEKSLQHLIEANLDELLGIRFHASEHATGKAHGGRIDGRVIPPAHIEARREIGEVALPFRHRGLAPGLHQQDGLRHEFAGLSVPAALCAAGLAACRYARPP